MKKKLRKLRASQELGAALAASAQRQKAAAESAARARKVLAPVAEKLGLDEGAANTLTGTLFSMMGMFAPLSSYGQALQDTGGHLITEGIMQRLRPDKEGNARALWKLPSFRHAPGCQRANCLGCDCGEPDCGECETRPPSPAEHARELLIQAAHNEGKMFPAELVDESFPADELTLVERPRFRSGTLWMLLSPLGGLRAEIGTEKPEWASEQEKRGVGWMMM